MKSIDLQSIFHSSNNLQAASYAISVAVWFSFATYLWFTPTPLLCLQKTPEESYLLKYIYIKKGGGKY